MAALTPAILFLAFLAVVLSQPLPVRRKPPRGRLRALPWALGAALLALGCGDSSPPEEHTGSQKEAVFGVDGALMVNGANTVLNQYAVLAADAAAGATSVSVTNVADLTSGAFGPLAKGDLVMIIQMQGAAIDTTDTVAYGNVTALNGAGRYELVSVAGVAGNTINLDASCAGLKFAYSAAGAVQVVRVPQLTTLTVTGGGSIVAPPWDGLRGGVVAVHAKNTITLNGPIDVSGAGFRGGAIAGDNQSQAPGSNITLFRSANAADGAEKGESIAGYQAAYANGRYGRGAPANGGGGGNSHNAGGGGGANGHVVGTWTGQGVMSAAVVGGTAWLLDPAYIANGNALTSSLGGGRGGYTYSANNSNALTTGPGNAAWGGDNRLSVGGLGGRPVDNDPAGRVFFGGGGGAGDGNNGGAGDGGRGGGIVFLFADTVGGNSQIVANGAAGTGTSAGGNDAPGGGGGGGSVIVHATTLSGITISANGGVGGSQNIAGNEAEGPGGGGGGGYIAVAGGNVTRTSNGSLGGLSNSGAVTEFPSNGATGGAIGDTGGSAANVSFCIDAAAPDTNIVNKPAAATNIAIANFTFTSSEPNSTFECSLDGAAFAPCTTPLNTAALADGPHTFAVRAIDLAGNVDPTPASYSWVVDTAAPDTSFIIKPPAVSNSSMAGFQFGATEPNCTFECNLDGGGFGPCGSTLSAGPLPDGSHTMQVRAIDPAGNVDPTPASYTWIIDTSPPDTSIVNKPPPATNVGVANFTFTSDDPTATFECSLDGAAFTPCTTPLDTPSLPDGSHTFQVRAKDTNGNVDPTPASYTWVVDTAPPDTSILTGPPNPTGSAVGDFTFSSDDPAATFECSIDGGAFAPCPASFQTPALAAGMHTLQVRAKDAAGNVDPTPASYMWVILVDSDGDGLSDMEEIAIGTNPNDADSDDDGVLDGQEPQYDKDSDGDGIINALDPDSDNDGIFDGTELGKDCSNPATDLSKNHCVADADGGATTTDPLAKDTDNGGIPDGNEDVNHNGQIDPGEGNPNDPADDKDTDGDGVPDLVEVAIGTNPNDADSDDDGLLDGQEIDLAADTDGDGLINALDPDSDNDGLFDGTELGKDCSNKDTDVSKHHCTADADPATKTDPLNKDTDGGGVSDGSEDSNLNGKIDAGESDPTAGHGADDSAAGNKDTDGDGLSDALEIFIGSDPNDADSDDDGLLDGQEPNPTVDNDGDGLIDVLDPDSDDDGLFDGTESGKDCADPATNPAAGHCIADADAGATKTSPLLKDTDKGGVSDGGEDTNHDGAVDGGETDPTAGHGADDGAAVNKDSDGDGLPDLVEIAIGTDPNDADSDDDGVPDGQEPNYNEDSDGDGKINALDPDSDGDGIWDGTELGYDCSGPGTDAGKGTCVPDGDMGKTKTSPLLKDTDHGGIQDGDEDVNKNGVIDAGETDPNDPVDDKMQTGCQSDTECGDSKSGKVCDPVSHVCEDGCHATGNGCPTGKVCTSSTDMIGQCVNEPTCKMDSDCGDATSGKVCNPSTGTCTDGCHTPGNGCPTGKVCTSSSDMIGVCIDLGPCKADSDCGDATSGKVCDTSVQQCVAGCHTPGNGCPATQECTSTDATFGKCQTPSQSDDQVVAQGSGLFCATRAAGAGDSSLDWLLVTALGGLFLARRRRRG